MNALGSGWGTQAARDRRRRRARARNGSAAIELLLMMPLLVLLMAVSFWATELYAGKMAAMKAVRGPVFTEAAFGCGNPGATSFDAPSKGATPGATPHEPFEARDDAKPVGKVDGADLGVVARKVPGAPGADILDRAVAARGSRVERPVAVNGLVGITTRVSGQTSMTCNESVHDGDPNGIKRVAGSSFDPRSP